MPIEEVSPLAPSPSTGEVIASDLIAQEQQKRRDFMQKQVLQQSAGKTGLLQTAAMDALDLNPMTFGMTGGAGRIFDSFHARVGTGMYQAVATSIDRPGVNQTVDAEFNPYGFIRDNPTVFKDDPLIDIMVERGQFDGSHNIDQFWYDYTDAKRFFDQQQQIETDWKNGHYLRNATTWAASMVLDPVNMVPLAFAGKGVSFLRGSAQSAGGVAALSLASKKVLDAGQPVANEPGLSDEAMSLVEGAIVGGGLHGLVAGAGMALKTDTARKILDRVAKSDKRTLAATFEAKANELEAARSAEVWTPEQAQSGESLVPAEQPIKNEAPAGTTPVAVDELATMDSAGSQVAPQSDSTPPTVVSFKTSKGSEYFVEGTTTTRNKSYHPEHGSADVGMKPRSLRTVYVNEEAQFQAASALGLDPEKQPSVKIEGDELVVRYKSGRDNARNLIQREKRFPISSTPEKGMAPIEFLEGSRVHVGNEITEISTAPAAQPPTPALPKPVASTGRAYSNADLERRIFDHAQSNSAELEAIKTAQARAASVSEGRRVSEQVNLQMDDTQIPSAGRKFRGKIPEELLNEMSTPEDRKILRRAVSVVVDSETGGMLKELPGDGTNAFGYQIKSAKDKSPAEVGTVGGHDLLSSIGAEAYANILREEAAGRSVSATISQMRMSNDPRSQLLVYLYDNRLATNRTKEANTYKTWFDDNGVFHKELVKKGEVKVAKEGEHGYVPAKDSFKADEIPVGATFKINGEVFNVIEDEHGFRVMRDGAEFPLDALDEIPIDRKGKKGTSLRMMTPEEIAATRIQKAENGPLTPAENAAVNDLLENEVLDHWAALEMDNAAKREAIYDGYVEMVAAKEQEVLQQSPERQRFEAEVGDVFGETGLEAIPAIDAFAKRWARSQGKSVDDYFKTLKVVKGGKPGEGALYSTIGWHGNGLSDPIEKFSMKFVGTGEGAQVYGHGLYFTDTKSIAEWYRDKLSKGLELKIGNEVITFGLNDKYYQAWIADNTDVINNAKLHISAELGNFRAMDKLNQPNGAKEFLQFEAQRLRERSEKSVPNSIKSQKLIDIADVLDSWAAQGEPELRNSGKLYKVELAPDEGDYLLWDKPLSEQSDKVKAAVKALDIDDENLPPFTTGRDVYDEAARMLGSPSTLVGETFSTRNIPDRQAASAALHKAGVRGVKYLDGNSRTKGKGAYNYVIFDDADVTIKEMFQQGQVGVQGSYEVLATGQRIIRKMEFADASTFIHEVGHDFLTMLPHVDPELADEAARALGAKSYADITVEHQEHWSRALEAFFREGKSPTKELEPMFKKFRQWLTDLYRAIIETPLKGKLNDDVRAVFKKMLSDEVTDTFDNHPLTEDELLTVSDLVGIDNLRKYSNAELRRFLSGDNLPGSVGAATATEIHTPKQMHPESVANSIRATYRELEWHLQQTPVDNTNITVTAIPGDKAWSLIEQLRAKYEAAGKTLIVHQSNEQPLYELFRTAADFTNRESQLVDALPKDFLYGGIDTAAAKIATRILDFTSSWATINGRLASQTMLGRISDVWKTVSGSSMTIPTGSAKDPFGFRWGTSAENFKLVLESKMTQAKQGIVEVFKAVDRKAEPIVFGDRTVTNFKEFGEALSEYAHQVQAQANGITDKAPHANTSKAIKDAYTFIRSYMDDQYSMMVEAGMLEAKLHPIKRYYSAVWKFDRVKADPVGFKFALEQEYRRVEAMKNGVQVPPQERPIVAEAAKRVKDALMPVVERRFASRNPSPVGSGFKLSAKDPLAPAVVIDEAAFLKELAQMTEGELRGDGLGLSMAEQQVLIRGAEAYEESVRKFYREAAENAYASLTNKADPQSIPTDGRTMRVDYSRMQPWLETNPMVVLDRYHHVVGGRLAVRRSIQLNPEVWGDAYLKDGTRVNDGATMKQYIGEMIDALDMAASHADSLNGVDIKDAGKPGTKLAEVAKLRSSVYADIAALIDKVEGRSPMPDTEELSQVFIASSRTLRRYTTANLMNSNLVNQAMDVAGIGMVRFAQNTEFVRMITGMAKSVRAISKKDMAPMLAQLERASLSRSFGDMDVNEVVLGHSQLRRAVRGAEGASIKLVDWQQKITLMDWWTKTIKQVAGRVAIEQTERNVRKMIRAYTEHTTAPSKGGIEAAMRKAGIDGYDARRTNFLVGNIQEMQLYAEQVYEHGFLDNGNPVKSEMTYEQFLATKKRITANFAEWETANPDVKNLLEKVQGNLAGEVNHRMVVTPGAGDQPRWATGRGAFAELGKMGTQFLNFQLAQSNQMFRTMAQQGAKKQANFFLQMFGLAVLVDLLKSELSGKRTAEQTAELWQKNPLGMTYNAMDQGGFLGILGKPMGIIDSLGSPYTPGNLLKAPTDQTAVRRRVTEKLDLLGPAPSMMGKAWDVFSGAASGRFNQQLAYNAWKLAPYQNLWWLRLLNRTTGLPVVPESIRPPSNTPQQQPRV